MKFLLFLVLFYTPNGTTVIDAHSFHQLRQVLETEVPVRATVCLTRSRWVLCEDLLTAEWAVPVAAPVRVPANIAIGVPDVVPVVFVELIIRNLVEGLPPKRQTLLQIQSNTLQEQRVLQATKVLEVGVATEGPVKVRHAGWEML